jgi:hypothetical protein
MLWVTRSRIRVNRAATGWLIRRFIDPAAAFRFVEPDDVERVQREQGALGFDAPGARYPHRDSAGRCSFEVLVQECCPCDPALRELARIVHWADFPAKLDLAWPRRAEPSTAFDRLSLSDGVGPGASAAAMTDAVGLRTISRGFPLVTGNDDETLARSAFLYDALYASLSERSGL